MADERIPRRGRCKVIETKEKPILPLTVRQSLFSAGMFTPDSETLGNGVESARAAGYKGTDNYLAMVASRNIRKDNIIVEKKRILVETSAEHIADRAERKKFWTDTMKTAPNIADRLRASELLGKSECDFVNINVDLHDEQQVLDEARQIQAKRIAEQIVANTNNRKCIESGVKDE